LDKKAFFTQQLSTWYDPDDRPLPWKGERDAYLIWLSEIILQQTRVEQGRAYYLKFKERFPRITDLADAGDDEVMKLWEGLGYYSRARNLLAAARHIRDQHEGIFPNNHEDIRALKGVGDYTAAAVASFAYGLPHAVVDGNVYRVLGRFFGIELPFDTGKGKRHYAALAQGLLDKNEPGRYNQAIMDFGATVCLPKRAACTTCPLQTECAARIKGKVYEWPVKSKKTKRKTRFFHYLVLNQGTKVFIRKRMGKDIWQHLYEFPLQEVGEDMGWKKLLKQNPKLDFFYTNMYGIPKHSKSYKQELTHRTIIARFHEITVDDEFLPPTRDWMAVERTEIRNFAFPNIIDLYLTDKTLYLELF
jgi:A/G-specific adenine glycosylase